MSLGKKILIGFGVLVVIGIISNTGKDKKGKSTDNSSSSTEQTSPTGVKIGEVLKTDCFDITVNKVEVKDKVSTGNDFSTLKPESRNSYLIMLVITIIQIYFLKKEI